MSEKSIPSRSTEAGANILQGRGGQAIIQDVVGNILLTTQNKTSPSSMESLKPKS